MLTEREARAVAIAAAEEVLARRPVPSCVTLGQAAEMLEVSRPTARRMLQAADAVQNAGGKYRIEDVWRARGPTEGPTKRASP
jgi:methylthioribose-1-phosphate isomerase